MSESIDVAITVKDSNNPSDVNKVSKVSTARLRHLINDQLTEVRKMQDRCEAIHLELTAIIHEIGEEW